MASVHEDERDLAQFGYQQKLDRSLGGFSSFAAGFSYISILTGMFQTTAVGFVFAGPAFVWAWIFVFAGQMMVALQFAELAAHYPLAGSVYQWSKNISGKRWGWNVGWMYLAAQIVTVPAVALAYEVILPQISDKFQIIAIEDPENYILFDPGFAKNAVLLGAVLILFTTIVNAVGVKLMALINNIGVAAELIASVGLIFLLLFHIKRSPLDILTETFGTGAGHSWGYFGALLVGAYMALYVMYGFDTAGSLAEETENPRRTAPRAILRALPTAAIMGFLLIMLGSMAVSDENYTIDFLGSAGLAGVAIDAFGETVGKLFLVLVVISITVCCLAIHAAGVRIIFAMARDGSLPGAKRLAHVSGSAKVPVVPAVLIGVIAMLILLFNIVNPKAFTIIVSCGILFMYLAYLGTTIPLLQKRLAGWPGEAGKGYFGLGSWGVITNVLAILYGATMAINLAWPRVAFYGDLWYQKWGVILATIVVVVVGLVVNSMLRGQGAVLDEHRVGTASGD